MAQKRGTEVEPCGPLNLENKDESSGRSRQLELTKQRKELHKRESQRHE